MNRRPKQEIDVSGIFDEETLHEYLSKTLGFPGYYGFNFDAFWDCICDDSSSDMPATLIVTGVHELIRHAPEAAEKFRGCLDDYRTEFPDREVLTSFRTCPCCGYMTFGDPCVGSYEICEVCFWEDDPVQHDDPNYEGGANSPSLAQAKENFRIHGRCQPPYDRTASVGKEFVRDPRWLKNNGANKSLDTKT